MTDDDALRFAVTSTIHKVSRDWRKLVRDAIVEHGISQACAQPLAAIARLGDGVRQGQIAEDVGIEGPSLVRLIDQLCGCGLVERRDDPADRRAKTLWLTARGRTVTRSIEGDLVHLRADILGSLSRADLHGALRVFAALSAAADAEAERPTDDKPANDRSGGGTSASSRAVRGTSS